jgi:hypothetical protein
MGLWDHFSVGCVLPYFGQAFWALGGADEFTDLLGIYSLI